MAEERFCANCRYLTGGDVAVWCEHPSNGRELVSGKTKWKYAGTMRVVGECGREAKLFEALPEPDFLQRYGLLILLGSIVLAFAARSFFSFG